MRQREIERGRETERKRMGGREGEIRADYLIEAREMIECPTVNHDAQQVCQRTEHFTLTRSSVGSMQQFQRTTNFVLGSSETNR